MIPAEHALLFQPPSRHGRQYRTLGGYRLFHHYIERADAIGCNDEQPLTTHVVNVAHLAPAEQRIVQGCSGDGCAHDAISSSTLSDPWYRTRTGETWSRRNASICCSARPVWRTGSRTVSTSARVRPNAASAAIRSARSFCSPWSLTRSAAAIECTRMRSCNA